MTQVSPTMPSSDARYPNRRAFLKTLAGTAAGLLSAPLLASASTNTERSLSFRNLHTAEALDTVYWKDGGYLPAGLRDINHLLRDHRTGEVYPIDPDLLDLLYGIRQVVERYEPFHLVSGYRSLRTNAMLRRTTPGVARRSLHTLGRAVDVRLPGCQLQTLRKAALALKSGGVGYYEQSNFLHLDVGRVRTWQQR